MTLRAKRILGPNGSPWIAPDESRVSRARYDAAQTSTDNARHWQWTDNLSAKSANSASVRRILRGRSRYEAANNCYASGLAETLADDLVGSGPRLQMQTDDDSLNTLIEEKFIEWSQTVCFADKLHTMREARAVDGETFMCLETDPNNGEIQLDLQLYEAEQISTPYPYPLDPLAVDGIIFDRHMKPKVYHRLRAHPGDDLRFVYDFEYDSIPARYVIHWFLRRRAHQYRGIPEFTPALALFAQLRRYTLAVLGAAETAANFAAVLETSLPPSGEAEENPPFDVMDIDRDMMTTVPAGWHMNQFRPEQPATTYEMFKREILNEIARTLKVPYNVAAGNSSSYNYASGRLDHQTYYRSIDVDHGRMEREICDRVFFAWLQEAAMVTRWVKGGLDRDGRWPHRWLWQGFEHVDPLKEANAQKIRLQSLSTTFTDECQKDGVDPESRAKTISKDIALFEEYGLPNPYVVTPAGGTPVQDPNQEPGDNVDQVNQGRSQTNGHSFDPITRRNGHIRP